MTDHPERRAVVQGYAQGIPWDLHVDAWNAYAKKYGTSQSAETINQRGGFGVGELDVFIPGWREKVSELGILKARIAELEAEVDPEALPIAYTLGSEAAKGRIADLKQQIREAQMLGHQWMARHDRIVAGEDPGPLPAPADMPDALSRLAVLEAENARLRGQTKKLRRALAPFGRRSTRQRSATQMIGANNLLLHHFDDARAALQETSDDD